MLDQFIQYRIDESRETESLDLRKLRLTAIPAQVYELKYLRELDLSSDAVVNESSVYLSEEYWWECSFDNNQITYLDSDLGKLTKLERLLLNQIELDSLPEAIGELGKLRELHVRNNGLRSLPQSIGMLTNLEVLDLSFNMLSSLPDSLATLKKLRVLNLFCNSLTELPEVLFKLPSLEELNIGTIQKQKVFPETVERFYLTGNSISTLPEQLWKMLKLRKVKVANLELTEINA